jgi:UTP:GlnB (protein PII) uridylyltransferase
MAAIGGYGAFDLTPGSDVDLLFVHEPDADGHAGAQRAVGAVLYALWDSGLRASHAVRTPAQCGEQGRADLASLTSMLGMRHLAGPGRLVRDAASAVRSVAAEDLDRFATSVRDERDERRARFGAVYERLEPDLKEAAGGLRDWQAAWWTALTRDGPVALSDGRPSYERAFAASPAAADACARLLAIRLALHLSNQGTSNALAAEHHQAVAGVIRPAPRPGWEPRDALLGDVASAARTVDTLVTALLGASVAMKAGPAAPWIRAVRACPEWEDVLGRPQRDPYHRYPVDFQLERTAEGVERLLRRPGDAFTAEAVHAVKDPDALLLGALLHDIGKVGRRGHAAVGTAIAPRVLDRLAVPVERREHVLFLVREHLLLSETATRRNIDDEDLVLHVAARVRYPQRLAMLYLLTVADAAATGSSASTPWRLGLVRDLVARVSRAFDRGLMDPGRAERFDRADSRVRRTLLGSGIGEAQVEAFLATVPAGYLQWVRAADVSDHVDLVMPPPGANEVRVHVAPGRAADTYRLTVGARDRLGLLAMVAGSLSVSGLSILAARAFTTSDGVALDAFDVRGAFEVDVGAARWRRFRVLLAGAFDGSVDLRRRVGQWRSHYRPPAATVPVRVAIDQEVSDFSTVVEVTAADRLGLLFDLAEAFAAAEMDVHVAKVATYGPRVVDVFYVSDPAGGKVTDGGRLAALEECLSTAASG